MHVIALFKRALKFKDHIHEILCSTRLPCLMRFSIMPTKKQIVSALMSSTRSEEQVTDHKTGQIANKFMLTYTCPKDNCRVRVIKIREGIGCTNPYRNLVAFYSHGKPVTDRESVVLELYHDALAKSSHLGGTILLHFSCKKLTHYELALFHYIRLITVKNLPLIFVQD